MATTPGRADAASAPARPANATPPDIATASVPAMLAALHINLDTGLTHAQVDVLRKEHGHGLTP
ncbi:MAG: hypothetical protein ABFE07_21670 [Armatimonadia bacterium]